MTGPGVSIEIRGISGVTGRGKKGGNYHGLGLTVEDMNRRGVEWSWNMTIDGDVAERVWEGMKLMGGREWDGCVLLGRVGGTSKEILLTGAEGQTHVIVGGREKEGVERMKADTIRGLDGTIEAMISSGYKRVLLYVPLVKELEDHLEEDWG